MATTTSLSRSRCRVNPPIGKALAANLRERGGGALFVRGLAMREAEVKLGAVALQMRFTDVMIRADQAALEQAEERFDRIGMRYFALNGVARLRVFLGRMVRCFVAEVS